MKALRLSHAHLKVRELERSVTFYRELLGLQITEQVDRAYAFLTGGPEHHTLALQALGPNAPNALERAVGLYHIAFEVENREAFSEAWERLTQAGIPFYPVDHRISWALYFEDPDGNGLEIFLDRRQDPDGAPIWAGANRPLAQPSSG